MKFSGMFLDFIDGNNFFRERFPLNEPLFINKEELEKISGRNTKRRKIADIIETGFGTMNLSEKQKISLELFSKPNSLAVITGQQAGFLGGPVYSALKLQTAVSLSEKLNKNYKHFHFIPIFWIEDNDHDNYEASYINIFNENYEPVSVNCAPGSHKEDIRTVSSRSFAREIHTVLDDIENIIPSSIYKKDLLVSLRQIYAHGKKWADTFAEFMQMLFSDTGILFCKASLLREEGMFSEIIEKELLAPGKTEGIIDQANAVLEKNGFHIQAKSRALNLFYVEDDNRIKIEQDNNGKNSFFLKNKKASIDEIRKLFKKHPENFSPNVMLRPICQDDIFPSAAYIGGPSEIAYLAQLKEVYENFNVPQPAQINRISATFLDDKTSRFLNKEDLKPDFFFREQKMIEKYVKERYLSEKDRVRFNKSLLNINKEFEDISAYAGETDKNLIKSAEAANKKVIRQLLVLKEKVSRRRKKKDSLLHRKYIRASNLIFPLNALQERVYSPVNFINICGFDGFKRAISGLNSDMTDRHLFVKI